MKDNRQRNQSGLTPASLLAMVLALILCGVLTQWEEVAVGMGTHYAEHSVPLPAIVVLLVFTVIGAVVWKLTRARLLSRSELLCVVYAMLIAVPLMTQGFWHRYLSVTGTLPRDPAMFGYLSAYSDDLWPHGDNLVEGGFAGETRSRWQTVGNASFETLDSDQEASEPVVVLENDGEDQVSAIRARIPRVVDDEQEFEISEPFMLSVEARPGQAPEFKLPGASRYYGKLVDVESGESVTAFSSLKPGTRTVLHKDGFVLVGTYHVKIPREFTGDMVLELGLEGPGRVALRNPKFWSMDAIESAYSGKQMITQSEYDALPAEAREGKIVRPDNLLSWAGIKFLFEGYIPVGQWMGPIVRWTVLVILLLTAALAINVLLRRQWMENERYLMPLSRIPISLIGSEGYNDPNPEVFAGGQMAPIWKNRAMWLGLVVTFIWIIGRAWSFYNPAVPDLSIKVPLLPYFDDPGYGEMWTDITFTVSAIFLSIAMFMELSILFSIFVGYIVYRSMFWLGEPTGWSELADYPFPEQMQTGSFLIYALMIIIFTRKYLWRVIKASFTGDKEAWKGELLPYPVAIGLLALCLVLSLVWAWMFGISLGGMATLFVYLIIVSMIATKIRTEAGAPFSYLGPLNASIILLMFGGVTVFGPSALIFATIVGFLVGGTPFFLIPGAQMELTEWGRRFRIKRWHLLTTIFIGVIGGMGVGAWVFLSNSYSIGGRQVHYSWPYMNQSRQFSAVRQQTDQASAAYREQVKAEAQGQDAADDRTRDEGGMTPKDWGYIVGGVSIGIVAALRQMFAGFWFHPVGILLAGTYMARVVWGSCLVAWLLRVVVLRFGGAATVRTKLQPFFVGVFVGAVISATLVQIHTSYLVSQGVDEVFRWPGGIP